MTLPARTLRAIQRPCVTLVLGVLLALGLGELAPQWNQSRRFAPSRTQPYAVGRHDDHLIVSDCDPYEVPPNAIWAGDLQTIVEHDGWLFPTSRKTEVWAGSEWHSTSQAAALRQSPEFARAIADYLRDKPRRDDGVGALDVLTNPRAHSLATGWVLEQPLMSGYLRNARLGACAALLVCSLAWLPRMVHARAASARHRRGLCGHCGYNRAGTPFSQPCPECGTDFGSA